MDFTEISDKIKVFPGEYLLYSPKNEIVLCGAFNRGEDYIRAFGNGRYIEDQIRAFKKISLETHEVKAVRKRKRCGGCKG